MNFEHDKNGPSAKASVKRRGKASKQRAYEKFISKVNEFDLRAFNANMALKYNLDEADAIRADSQLMQEIDRFNKEMDSRRSNWFEVSDECHIDPPSDSFDLDEIPIDLPVTGNELISIVDGRNPPSATIIDGSVKRNFITIEQPCEMGVGPSFITDQFYSYESPVLNGFSTVSRTVCSSCPLVSKARGDLVDELCSQCFGPSLPVSYQSGDVPDQVKTRMSCIHCSIGIGTAPGLYDAMSLDYPRLSHAPEVFSLTLNGFGSPIGQVVPVRADHYVVQWLLSRNVVKIRFKDGDLYRIYVQKDRRRARVIFRLRKRSPCPHST